MPVEILSDEQAAAYGAYTGAPTAAELEGFFFLDDADLLLVQQRRGDHNRLGFALQLKTVGFLGTFLQDPLQVPWPVVEYLGGQLRIADISVVKGYAERPATQWEHAAAIRSVLGYVEFSAGEPRLREFLSARAWTRPERPSDLFDQAVTWLRTSRVLLPGVSVLARLVAEIRATAAQRLHRTLADAVGVELEHRLLGLLDVPAGARWSELDRLRRAPTRASGQEMVRALDRAAEIVGLGAGVVDLAEVPAGRVEALARNGLSANVTMLRRLPVQRRSATLLATARALQVAAVDDALDLFAVLMATKLIGAAERASVKERLRSVPELQRASLTLATAARVLLELVDASGDKTQAWDPALAWATLQAAVPRDRLAAAVSAVDELTPGDRDDAAASQRAELVKRYATVRPFLALLGDVLPLAATQAGAPVLTAVRRLAQLIGRKRVRRDEVIEAVVTGSWSRLVFASPDLPPDSVDGRAYALCVLEGLHRALRRRDVYAVGSPRWGDPRAALLDGPGWEQARPQVLTARRLTEPVETHLTELAGRLDAAYLGLAAQLETPGQPSGDAPVRLEAGPDRRMRLHLARLDPVEEPATLTALREMVARMLPRVDLPEVLLEVHAWTGYLSEFTHVAMADGPTGSRMAWRRQWRRCWSRRAATSGSPQWSSRGIRRSPGTGSPTSRRTTCGPRR